MITAEELKAQIQSQQLRQYSLTDLAAFQQVEPLLRNAGMDVDHEHAAANAKPITDYFEKNRNIAISVQTIVDFVNANPTLFKFRTPAQRRFDVVVANEGVERGQQMLDYLARQKQLVNSGDLLCENAAELLQELHGRAIDSQTVLAAIGRISAPSSKFDTRRRGQLHFVQASTHKLSHAAQQDDPNRKFGQFLDPSTVNKTPADYLRERNLASQANEQTPEVQLSKEEASWRQLTNDLLRFGTHSQQAQIKALVDGHKAQGVSWRQTFEASEKLVNTFKRAAMVRYAG
jgi:hypothetical protein